MKLKILRFLERLFFSIGTWIEDYGDSIDTELHDALRKAMIEPQDTIS